MKNQNKKRQIGRTREIMRSPFFHDLPSRNSEKVFSIKIPVTLLFFFRNLL